MENEKNKIENISLNESEINEVKETKVEEKSEKEVAKDVIKDTLEKKEKLAKTKKQKAEVVRVRLSTIVVRTNDGSGIILPKSNFNKDVRVGDIVEF